MVVWSLPGFTVGEASVRGPIRSLQQPRPIYRHSRFPTPVCMYCLSAPPYPSAIARCQRT